MFHYDNRTSRVLYQNTNYLIQGKINLLNNTCCSYIVHIVHNYILLLFLFVQNKYGGHRFSRQEKSFEAYNHMFPRYKLMNEILYFYLTLSQTDSPIV